MSAFDLTFRFEASPPGFLTQTCEPLCLLRCFEGVFLATGAVFPHWIPCSLVSRTQLGVNGYSFIITNNGFLLYHPDLRPLFRDMLVPFYGSVDMTQVELPDRDVEPGVSFEGCILCLPS